YSFGQLPRAPAPTPAPEPVAAPAPPPPPPAPAPAPRPEPEVIFEFDSTVTFGFDSAVIRPEAESELNRAAGILRQRDEIILLEVAGHTDSVGSEEYNRDLSQRRAQSVADYLENRGIARERMRVVGFGESRPKVSNTTPENRAMNRRVVLSILQRRN
ncbi:MAG: OmpA family protein, partial [Xanthomonadaceae bacterium]|nr:OmpA family protein [Xanthomonadaceae bacterium]